MARGAYFALKYIHIGDCGPLALARVSDAGDTRPVAAVALAIPWASWCCARVAHGAFRSLVPAAVVTTTIVPCCHFRFDETGDGAGAACSVLDALHTL